MKPITNPPINVFVGSFCIVVILVNNCRDREVRITRYTHFTISIINSILSVYCFQGEFKITVDNFYDHF